MNKQDDVIEKISEEALELPLDKFFQTKENWFGGEFKISRIERLSCPRIVVLRNQL